MAAREDQGVGAGALVLGNPLPADEQLDPALHDRTLAEGLELLARDGITGKAVTPFLLAHFHSSTEGKSLAVNVRIILRNAALAAQIAVAATPGAGGARVRAARVTPSLVVGDLVTDVLVAHAGPLADRLRHRRADHRRRGRAGGEHGRLARPRRRAGDPGRRGRRRPRRPGTGRRAGRGRGALRGTGTCRAPRPAVSWCSARPASAR